MAVAGGVELEMGRRGAICGILLLLCGVAVAVDSDEFSRRRELKQVLPRPAPEGGSPEDWEVIKDGAVQGITVFLFDRIEEPRDALTFAFGEMVFSSQQISPTLTRLVLASSEWIDIENTRSGISRPGLFHLFRITGHSGGIFQSGNSQISVEGSQFFIQILGISSARVEIGWLGSVNPDRFSGIIKALFQGVVEEMVDRFKAEFGGGDCVNFGPEAVVRDISAVCNNVNNPFGIAHIGLKNILGTAFGDGQSSPGGSDISARKISNIVSREDDNGADDGQNPLGVTDLFTIFGQFLDHDIGVSPVGAFATDAQPLFATSFREFFDEKPIEVPDDDLNFSGELEFERAVYERENNQEVLPRRILNALTSYLDLSQVYGSTALRSQVLRSFQDGKLKTSGSDFLPFNGERDGGVGIAVDNAPNAGTRFPVSGDIRTSENTLLQVLHTLFLREHNKVASELKDASGGSLNDEQLFQFARAIVNAEYQSITYTEWLPLLIGSNNVNPDQYSYDPNLDATADAFFTTASFRFGHTMVNGQMWKVDPGNTTPSSSTRLRDAFFQPEVLQPGNYDQFLRGMTWHQARNTDEKVIDDLRIFLYTDNGQPNMDLVALNIQRARDMGVPTYNAARQGFGLQPASSFSDISDNPDTVQNMEEAYNGDVNLVESFIGGLAEKKPQGKLFGDLFRLSHEEQFRRFMNGDRFFYRGLVFAPDLFNQYPRLNDILADRVKMIDIMERNTGVTRGDLFGRQTPFQL